MATDSVPDATPSNEQQQQEQKKKTPVVMLVVGMAGSGKTTFMQRIASQLYSRSMAKRAVELERILAQARAASAAAGAAGEPESTTSTSTSTEQQAPTSQDDSATASTSSAAAAASSNKNADADADAAAKTAAYIINLDPAVLHVPFPTNIDIRDTVNYKEVMKQYRLGPNGAIMTSLNLFSTQFHQVVNLIESKAQDLEYGSPTFTFASWRRPPPRCLAHPMSNVVTFSSIRQARSKCSTGRHRDPSSWARWRRPSRPSCATWSTRLGAPARRPSCPTCCTRAASCTRAACR